MSAAASRRTRISRRDAAKILGTSKDNVRRLERTKQLLSRHEDSEGTVTYERREVEALAQKRGLQIKPTGELAARVFEMFEARKPFAAIVIETKQEPDTIRALWRDYRAGFDDVQTTPHADSAEDHEERMKTIDRELQDRRSRLGLDGT